MALREALCVSALVVAGPALADDFIEGVYLQSEDLCAQAKKDGVETVADGGNTVLSADGIQSVEYNCEFVQISKANGTPAWAVTAICSEPGYVFPDLLSITQLSPTQIDIVSVRPAGGEGDNAGNTGSYVLCEGLTMP